MKHIVVIGGGPAGIEAALAAARGEAQVTLVSDAPVGGRAGWHSLLPSKVWLAAADALGLIDAAHSLGVDVGNGRANRPAILERIKNVKAVWNEQQAAALDAAGVRLVTGVASFSGPRGVVVHHEGALVASLEADSIIVTAGSVPRFPPNLKPDGKSVIAPRFASQLAKLPESMIVIGAGATGCEFAYLFNRVGVETTWIVDQYGILPQFDPDAGWALGHALVRQGVRLVQDQMAERIEHTADGIEVVLADEARYAAEMAFVAIGRTPDWSRLNLEAAGLDSLQGRMEMDGYGRISARPHIYFVGDAAGGWMVANKATAQARIAGRHAAGLPTPAYDANTIVLATYTEPQVAQVGRVQVDEGVSVARLPLSASLKAHLLPDAEGFVSLTYRKGDRRLLGGVAVAPHAADVLTPVALALALEATIDDLAAVYAAHPTLSELGPMAARAAQ